jgi:hypothetical protein
MWLRAPGFIFYFQKLYTCSPYTMRCLDLWPWPIWSSQISSKWGNWWIFDFWDSWPSLPNMLLRAPGFIFYLQKLYACSPYTKRCLDLWPWPIWSSQISSKWGNWWIFDLWDSRSRHSYMYVRFPGTIFIFKNYIHALLTPWGVFTFDPDQIGQAKFRKSEAIGEFLIFEIHVRGIHICTWGCLGPFLFLKIIYMLSLHHEVSWPLTLTNLVKPNFVKLRQLVNFWFLRFLT